MSKSNGSKSKSTSKGLTFDELFAGATAKTRIKAADAKGEMSLSVDGSPETFDQQGLASLLAGATEIKGTRKFLAKSAGTSFRQDVRERCEAIGEAIGEAKLYQMGKSVVLVIGTTAPPTEETVETDKATDRAKGATLPETAPANGKP